MKIIHNHSRKLLISLLTGAFLLLIFTPLRVNAEDDYWSAVTGHANDIRNTNAGDVGIGLGDNDPLGNLHLYAENGENALWLQTQTLLSLP